LWLREEQPHPWIFGFPFSHEESSRALTDDLPSPRRHEDLRAAHQFGTRMLPIGQALWLKHLQTYIVFPPLQNPASYNLEQVMRQVREMKSNGLSD